MIALMPRSQKRSAKQKSSSSHLPFWRRTSTTVLGLIGGSVLAAAGTYLFARGTGVVPRLWNAKTVCENPVADSSQDTVFVVLLADMANDDSVQISTQSIEEMLDSNKGVVTYRLRYPLTPPAWKRSDKGRDHVEREARKLLSKCGGDVLVWGRVLQDRVSLSFVTPGHGGSGGGDRLGESLQWRPGDNEKSFHDQFYAVLFSSILPKSEKGDTLLVENLKLIAKRLRPLLPDSTVPPLDPRANLAHAFGIVAARIGEEENDLKMLEEAVAAYRVALPGRDSAGWLDTQNALGSALRIIGSINDKPEPLEEAIETYMAALARCDSLSPGWATTKNNLGIALRNLGELERNPKRIKAAIRAYRDPAHERRRNTPSWALTQSNLGVALRYLHELTSDPRLLEEAVDAYQAALRVYTAADHPRQRARTQHNLAVALRHLGECRRDTGRVSEAIEIYRTALRERTRERSPERWASTQHNLGNALQSLGAMTNNPQHFSDAIAVYDSALLVRTRESTPAEWARTNSDVCSTYVDWGTMVKDARWFVKAADACHRALEVRSGGSDRVAWATTQYHLGNALRGSGVLNKDRAKLEAAIAAYDSALHEQASESAPPMWDKIRTARNLAEQDLQAFANQGDAPASVWEGYRCEPPPARPIDSSRGRASGGGSTCACQAF